jgi:Domain of unknown function (DUF5666)
MQLRNTFVSLLLGLAIALAASPSALASQAADTSGIAKQIGTIKAINGNAITLTPDSGPDVAVTVADNARLLRLNPGDKDLKNATPIQLQDLKVGDKVRVRGHAAGEGIRALEVLVITSSAVDAVRNEVRQDWQKRGVSGLVDSVDSSAGTVTVEIPSLMNKRTLVIHTTKNTVIYRYAPDSAKPEDARHTTLADVHVGDQLRARGERSSDGSEVTAEEIYTGVFPRLAGTIKSIDASSGTFSVQDLATKKTIQLKVASDSQLHKLPPEMAQRMAYMLKAAKAGGIPGMPGGGQASGATPAGGTPQPGGGTPPAGNAGMPGAGQPGSGPGGGFRRPGGGFDIQRMLDQTPAVTLADLHKGDAVAVLATEGSPSGASTVVKLFSGVEPILEAAPSASQAMMLTPWTLGGAPGGDATQ